MHSPKKFISLKQFLLVMGISFSYIFYVGIAAEPGVCGGDCVWSEDCAKEAGDTNCRCTYFNCEKTEGCGGGCLETSQCLHWSNSTRCVCGPLFECINRKLAESQEYKVFAKFMLSAKGGEYPKKIAEMTKRYKKQIQTHKNRNLHYHL